MYVNAEPDELNTQTRIMKNDDLMSWVAPDPVTQADIDLAEQDVRDREQDFTDAYAIMHNARLKALKAKVERDVLVATFKAYGTDSKE
jgi:hypothetical protein